MNELILLFMIWEGLSPYFNEVEGSMKLFR